MSQFKVGDLALTKVDRSGVPAMSQVELDRFVRKGEKASAFGGGQFAAPEDAWLCASPYVPHGLVPYRSTELMPLRGDFTPEREKSSEVPA